MPEPWTELEDAGTVVIAFDGMDADKRDAAELAAFARDLATPARDDFELEGSSSSPMLFDRGATQSLTSAMRAMFYFVLGIATGWLAMWGGASLAGLLGVPLGGLGQIVLFFLGLLTPVSLAMLRDWRAHRAKQALPRDRFTLRLDASGLSVSGEHSATRTFEIDAIDGFEPGRRIAVRKRDGTREHLPCTLPVAGDHAALTARLDAALRTVRSATTGYRGASRVRIAVEEAHDDDDALVVASSTDRSAHERDRT
jgi:hypothetical protein